MSDSNNTSNTSCSLAQRKCVPCEGGIPSLTRAEATGLMSQIHPEWQLTEAATEIHRVFRFKNYYSTMAFVNAIAWIAHDEDHHPDLVVRYNECVVSYRTHAIDGLSQNDFICAAKVDALLEI